MKHTDTRKKHLLRTAALLLCLLTALPLTAACGGSGDGGDGTVGDPTDTPLVTEGETAAPDSLDARKEVSDGVPTVDYKEKKYRIFYQKRYTTDAVSHFDHETGDKTDDAVYRRNRAIEERFNVHIVGIEGEEDPMVVTLMNAVSTGEDAYDLYLGHTIFSGKAALAGYFYNWYDIPHMDFSKPWFPKATIDGLTVNDRMYMTTSDLCISFVYNTYCFYFNKALAEANDLPDLFEVVDEGKWTLDTLGSYVKEIYTDLNMNNTRDADDLYGFVTGTGAEAAPWPYACVVPTVAFGEGGTVESVFNSERANTMLSKLRDLINVNPGGFNAEGTEKGSQKMFMDGQAVFATGLVGTSESAFRELTMDYGIIPYPKLDEAQDGYYTIPGGSISGMAVPVTVEDTDFVGAITMALARESWVSVMPEYYDVVLKVKGARDPDSVRMLDLIMAGRSVDTAYMYDNFTGYVYGWSGLLTNGKELSSFTAGKDKAVIKHYENVMKLFWED